EARYRLDAADVILSLDADPFAWAPGRLRYMHDFAQRRRPEQASLSRTYAVESTPSLLGAAADHRLAMPAGAIQPFAFALAAGLGIDLGASPVQPPVGVPAGWLDALAEDLRRHGPRALVIAGEFQPAAVHAVAHALNFALGSMGTTVEYTEIVEADPVDQSASLRELVANMLAGDVTLLMVLDGNPAYTAPTDVPFTAGLNHVETRVHLGVLEDETSAVCNWHIPALHSLEGWSDVRAFDGSVTILQPLIAPLADGHSVN